MFKLKTYTENLFKQQTPKRVECFCIRQFEISHGIPRVYTKILSVSVFKVPLGKQRLFISSIYPICDEKSLTFFFVYFEVLFLVLHNVKT